MAPPRGGKKRKAANAAANGAADEVPAAKAAKASAPVSPAAAVAEPGGSAGDGAVAPSGGPAAGKGVYKAPDAEEVMEISRTQSLYKSNLFRLQLEELLRELAPPRAAQPHAEGFLRALKGVLEGLYPRKIPESFVSEFPELRFHQQQPFPFDFAAPKRIDVVGSFLLGTCSGTETIVDIAVEMPSASFQSKDYLNFRYLDKRAAYAGEMLRQLQALFKAAPEGVPMHGVQAEVEPLLGDLHRPCVRLRPPRREGRSDGAFVVRLLPTYAADLFPISKLAADRNLVRAVAPPDAPATAPLPPTPLYNSCLVEDCRMRAHLEVLHKAFLKTPALKDAVLLLKRWASARSFLPQRSGAGFFIPLSGFCLSIVAAHAAQTSNMSASQTSSFQLFKLALSVLASTEWPAQKLSFGKAVASPVTAEEMKACGAHFYDADGVYNFFWRLGPFIAEIRWEAQRALRTLDVQSDPFEAVFGQLGASPALMWDLVVRTPPLGPSALCPGAAPGRPSASGDTPQLEFPGAAPADAPQALSLAARLSNVFAEGLADRCTRTSARLVSGDGGGVSVAIGVQLDAVNLDRALDRGPSAESAEAKRFKELWGAETAELRRFKDGSVLECAVWAKPPAGRSAESKKQPAVVTQIVRKLLGRHFPEVASGADIITGAMGVVTNLGERERRLWVAFQAFRAHLCQLSSLPLTIKDVHPSDRSFSYMELALRNAPSAADGIQRTLHDTVVEFESSARWPDNPEAARKVAGAMMLQMKDELQSDLGIEADVTADFIDVRYPEFVFRIRIFHEQELRFVAHRVTNFTAPPSAVLPSDADIDRLRSLWWRPRVRQALHATVLQRPALAGAVRLCQRWLGSQLLAGYEEFVEHLVAASFLTSAPFETPTSPQVGLCRMCWLLDAFDWEREPFVVDFDGKLAAEERLAIRRSFERSRSDATSTSSFWIASRFDPHAILLPCPPATVSLWLRRRAKHALAVCHRRLLGIGVAPSAGGAAGWDALFALDTSVFDVVVRLRPLEEGAAAAGDSAEEPRKKGPKSDRLRAAAAREAVRSLVGKLRSHLSSVCLVFHDADSRVVALKWRPTAFFPQHHNVLMGAIPHTMIPQGSGQPPLCVPNVLYLTCVVASLAEGMALDVTVMGSRCA